jgi:hypothetical protein
MIEIKEDLRELDLSAADLSDIFWRKDDDDGVRNLVGSINQQHRKMKKLLDERAYQELRTFVAQVVALGAIRGLNWGLALKERDSRRKKAGSDQIVRCILKHQKVVELLLASPKVSTRDICVTLDNRTQRLPWPKLARVDRLWSAHYSNATVKNAIKRARNEALQTVEDIRYLRPLTRTKRSSKTLEQMDRNRRGAEAAHTSAVVEKRRSVATGPHEPLLF